jgi:PAS domain S-box-containing protein
MPDMDGIAFLKLLRKQHPTLPFIIFTGKGREEVAIQAFENGADFYIQKGGDPISQFADLIQKIRIAVDRHRTTEALRASEERYRAVVEDQTELICRFTPDGKLTFTNDAYCRYFCVDKAQCIGQQHQVRIPAGDSDRVKQHFAALTPDNPSAIIEHRIIMPSGEVRWQRWSDRAIFDADGQVIEYQSVGRDSTAKRQADAALRKTTALLTDVGRMAHVGGWELDVKTQVVRWTEETYRIHDIQPGEMMDLANALRFFDERDRPRLEAAIQRCAETGEPYDLEIGFTSAKGRHLWTRTIGQAVTVDGVIVGLQGVFQDITAQKAAETALAETKDHLENLIDYASAPIIVWDPGLSITRFNHAFEHLTGCTANWMIGQPIDVLFPEESRERSKAQWWESVEIPIRRRDGTIRHVLWNSATVYAPDGITPTATIAQGIDITERKLAEEALAESRERYLSLFDRSLDCIYLYDLEGNFIDANTAALELTGYTREEIPRMSLSRLIVPGLLQKAIETTQVIIKTGYQVRVHKTQIRTKSGSILDVETRGTLITRDQRPYAIMGIARDVTAKNAMESALIESEQRLNLILEGAGAGLWDCNLVTGAMVVNERWAEIGGYTLAELSPVSMDTWRALCHPDDLLRGEEVLTSHLAGRVPVFECEWRMKHRDGSWIWVLDRGRVVESDTDGHPVRMTGVKLDISRRKEAEAARDRVQERLNRALSAARVGIWEWNVQTNAWHIDTGGVLFCGYADSEIVELLRSDINYRHPNDEPVHAPQFFDTRTHSPEFVAEFDRRVRAKDGSWHWMHLKGSVIRWDDSGRPLTLSGTFCDITNRRQIADALKESEEKFRSVVESAAHLVFVYQDGKYVYTNPAVSAVLGWSRDELINQPAWSIVAPEYHELAISASRERIAGETVPPYEIALLTKAGGRRYVEVRGSRIVFAGQSAVLNVVTDITERKQAESAVQEMNTRLMLAMSAAEVAVWTWDLVTDERAHIGSGLLFGYTSEELDDYFRHLPDHRHPDDPAPSAIIGNVFNVAPPPAGKPRELEYRIQAKDGTWHWGLVQGNVVARDSSGAPSRIMGTLRDITERKAAEQALRDSEEHLRAILATMPFGVVIIDANTHTILDVNDAAVRMIESRKEEILGSVCHRYICPAEKGRCPITDLGQTVDASTRVLLTRQGTKKPVLKSVVQTTFGGKNVLVESFIDITERTQAEDAIRRSEERYRSLLEHVPELILVHKNGIILYANPSALHGLGYTEEEAIHRNLLDFVAPVSHEQVKDAIRRRLQGEAVPPYEIEIHDRAGKERSVIVNGSQIEFEGAEASLIVLADITELKALHDAIHLANKKLNLLSAITRHDILNQLLALNGYLELSQDILHDPVKLKDYLTKEQAIADTIEAQIRFTKDYQELGIQAPVWQRVQECVTTAVASLPLGDLPVETDSDHLEVFADPLLGKVFFNLIDNALKYGGEHMTRIRINSQPSDHGLVITCADDGVGVSADKKEAIFNRGYFKHTGFGLYLSREILGITGITITETGEPEKGARFEIIVPEGKFRFAGDGKND